MNDWPLDIPHFESYGQLTAQSTSTASSNKVFLLSFKCLSNGIWCCNSQTSASNQVSGSVSFQAAGNFSQLADLVVNPFSLQGKATEAVKDSKVRAAKERGVSVVSPYWLLQCKDKHSRLQEAMFPITFNPGMAMVRMCIL